MSLYTDIYSAGSINCNIRKNFFNDALRTYIGLNYNVLVHSKTHTAEFRHDTRYDKLYFLFSFSARYNFTWGNKRARVNRKDIRTTDQLRINN